MKNKIISTLLVLVVMLSIMTPAFADTIQSETPLTPETTTPADEVNDSSNSQVPADSGDASDDENTDDEDSEGENPGDETEDVDSKDEEPTDEETQLSKKEEAAEKYRQGLAAYIRSINKNLSKSWSYTLAGYFINAGKKYDLDPKILVAVAQRESTFRAKVTNPYGIKGMMQTTDLLARTYGYKPSSLYKAKVSIDVGARYLSSSKKKFGNYTKALSAYVYGSYNVSKGRYSKSSAYAVLKIRRNIKAFLEKKNYI